MICVNCETPVNPATIVSWENEPWSIFLCSCGQEWEVKVPITRNNVRNAEPLFRDGGDPRDTTAVHAAATVRRVDEWLICTAMIVALGLIVCGLASRIVGG
jgi:hypothetical protein